MGYAVIYARLLLYYPFLFQQLTGSKYRSDVMILTVAFELATGQHAVIPVLCKDYRCLFLFCRIEEYVFGFSNVFAYYNRYALLYYSRLLACYLLECVAQETCMVKGYISDYADLWGDDVGAV